MPTKLMTFVLMLTCCRGVVFGQEGWLKVFGGKTSDTGRAIAATSDSGYVLIGTTHRSWGGEVSGDDDILVIKTNELGNVEWKKTYGGSKDESGQSIAITADGGYVLTGHTDSNDGHFWGMNKGGQDIFVIKLDAEGVVEWKKLIGGSKLDESLSITASDNGDLFLTGYTESNDGDFATMLRGNRDIIVIKLDERGDVQLKRTYGGSSLDNGNNIASTPDGGSVLTGMFFSDDGDFNGMNQGRWDIFIFKLDERGDVQWKKTIGGRDWDEGCSIAIAADSGYVLTGRTFSNDGDFKGLPKGWADIFVIKLDMRGNVQWQKSIGGSSTDEGYSITTTVAGGYVLSGRTSSNDGDFTGMNKDLYDIFIIKLDPRGDVQWSKTFGGSAWDEGYSVSRTPHGGFVLTGLTSSDDGDFDGMNIGSYDVFVIKLDSNGIINSTTSVTDAPISSSTLNVYPNPLSSGSNITYTIDQPSQVRIELVSSIGDAVLLMADKQEQAGTHQLSINTSTLPSGIYTVRMTHSGGVAYINVVVLR